MRSNGCVYCSGALVGTVVYVSGGAMLLTRDRTESVVSKRLSGFLNIGMHGTDPNMLDSKDIEIVREVIGGQFDLAFCGLSCLRAWFQAVTEQLE